MKYLPFSILVLLLISCQQPQAQTLLAASLTPEQKAKQDRLIETYATNKAHQYNYTVQLKEWQDALDEGLAQDPTIAYLWQQKAMPYFKARKYEVGMAYINKAVLYDAERYLGYRAFIKCIFSKTYREAIADFETCIAHWGDRYEMDHTYTFYIGLSYLQLNEFDKAEAYFLKAVAKQKEVFPDVHHLELFYLGIVCYEQERFAEAIAYFDQAVVNYKEFSDAYYYKGLCQWKMNEPKEKIKATSDLFFTYNEQGFSINEANAIYERYPYQIPKQNKE
ncbi:tetratricopeptide repeat protein [Myroides fluvii]|uniref:tetratricopeptide repeat protein n=1 Tax=Myroides fluvii TaxID=2572594 RepID=UPI00131AD658|nr:tetratricopeptide repeat protein [Myroides fluvii]